MTAHEHDPARTLMTFAETGSAGTHLVMTFLAGRLSRLPKTDGLGKLGWLREFARSLALGMKRELRR
jgi:hypothetical protein